MRTQLVSLGVLLGGGVLLALSYAGCAAQQLADDDAGSDVVLPIIPACPGDVPAEGCKCSGNSQVDCYEGPKGTANRGLCKNGQRSCVGGVWSKCDKQVVPAPELCDFKDNDCNEKVDDIPSDAGPIGTVDGGTEYTCETPFEGVCKPGVYGCSPKDAGPGLVCQALIAPDSGTEECNLLDDDCNGQVDENLTDLGGCDYDGGKGECVHGSSFCNAGTVDCKIGTSATETCDGKDNNCDGIIDNNACSGNYCCSYSSYHTCTTTKYSSPYVCVK